MYKKNFKTFFYIYACILLGSKVRCERRSFITGKYANITHTRSQVAVSTAIQSNV